MVAVGEVGENPLQRVGIGRQSHARVVANVVRIVIEERVLKIGLNARFQRAPASADRVRGVAEEARDRSP